jgi:3-oxoacyl-[acyl-carrier protein] reductase
MDSISLQNRTALVTGASRGIGKSLALRLAEEGANLILTATTLESLGETEAEIRAGGGTAHAIACDLSEPSQIRNLAEEAPKVFGGLDILVNNAGVSVNKPILATTDEEWDRCQAVNARAIFILCRETIPVLSESDAATILNIGSVVGIKGYANQGAYGASKHALMGFTKVLAQEVQPLGIRVHAINPGAVNTEMVRTMRPDLDPEGLIQPEALADWVVYLLTHRNSAVIDDLHLRRASGDPWFS